MAGRPESITAWSVVLVASGRPETAYHDQVPTSTPSATRIGAEAQSNQENSVAHEIPQPEAITGLIQSSPFSSPPHSAEVETESSEGFRRRVRVEGQDAKTCQEGVERLLGAWRTRRAKEIDGKTTLARANGAVDRMALVVLYHELDEALLTAGARVQTDRRGIAKDDGDREVVARLAAALGIE